MMQQNPVNLERAATGPGGLFYGVYPALVIENVHPKRPGAIKVRLPMLAADDDGGEVWARMAVPMAGANRGTFFLPEVDDEVLVAFEAGNVQRPYIVGALWNGQDMPPVDANQNNDVKAIVTRSGIQITFDDDDGGANLRLETPGGHVIELDDDEGQIDIHDNRGNSIKLTTSGISIDSSASVAVNASTVKVDAGLLDVETGMAKFSGVVQCETLITNTVIATTYTPGAGNIW